MERLTVIYRVDKGAKPVLSGVRKINDFSDRRFDQLYVNGEKNEKVKDKIPKLLKSLEDKFRKSIGVIESNI